MLDRRLESVLAAADAGSFSRAAARMSISTPALVKQVTSFESEFGVRVFERTHAGVTLTSAGALLVDDARRLGELADEALRRAREAEAAGSSNLVRLGVSLMAPGRNTQAMWPRVHELAPDLHLQIVQVGDLYDSAATPMTRLGREVDVVQTSYSTSRWGGSCQLLKLFSTPFYVDVLRSSPLARRSALEMGDLSGLRVRMLRHANDATDDLRDELMLRNDVTVVDSEAFDFDLFNEAAERGDAVLTSGAWSGVHPAFTGVPLNCGFVVPCFLAYAEHPAPQVERFVRTLARVVAEGGAV